ncbi:hypothetical protein [Bacillus swezeyi]|uniref:Uncharacterized protein n=1 Tax=Bacillus swezeyi TaxID=1925020 RepID=A0A5M8RRP8_9BACI|nr:hypothetical protein [Bacillus swezeyi]KAA6451245.1 hypothetical protein DX927_10655 [Bacillus swezeyi]TYS37723.1 hypothetical protein FZC77_10085 [Bacillus swezeyi]
MKQEVMKNKSWQGERDCLALFLSTTLGSKQLFISFFVLQSSRNKCRARCSGGDTGLFARKEDGAASFYK